MEIRNCFRELDRDKREKLHLNVLLKVDRLNPQRQSLRNLFTDAVTPREIIESILDYLSVNGYPIDRKDQYHMNSSNDWLRKAGEIRIPNPKYVLSIQKLESIISSIIYENASLTSEFNGCEIDYNMSSEDFLENVKDIQEIRELNNSKYTGPKDKIKIRSDDEENLWVTWNEENPDEVSLLRNSKENQEIIFKQLGLGFNLGNKTDSFIGIVFDISNTKMKLIRPGWGDATTYYYWQSIKDESNSYGYTKAIDMNPIYDQPESVSKNENFHLDLISDYSFVLS